jgi:hypothetical protein
MTEPFGYFKAEPFGWTDCAETDEGAVALYSAPPAQEIVCSTGLCHFKAQRPWVGLTQDEFIDFASTFEYGTGGLIRAIEAKLKEKNDANGNT